MTNQKTCENCNHTVQGRFCSNCGVERLIEPINEEYFIEKTLVPWEKIKSFFVTVFYLFVRPGRSMREYLVKDRQKYMEALMFLMITSGIYTFTVTFFGVTTIPFRFSQPIIEQEYLDNLLAFFREYLGYFNLCAGFFIAFILHWMFQNYRYNVYQIMVVTIFVIAQLMFILSLKLFLMGIFRAPSFLQSRYFILDTFYFSYAIGDFFDKKPLSYLKGGIAYLIGFGLVFAILLAIVFLSEKTF